MPTAKPPEKFQFGDFELDTGAYELRREGKPIRLERQPMDLLTLLVERGSQLVTRSDIVNRLWGEGVFVDVEMGINTAIRKIRHALHDSPANSTFIETVPGKGYRFIVKVEVGRDHGTVSAPIIIGVLPFENLSADTAREYLADGLTEEVIASLGQIDPEHLGVIGRTSMMSYKHTTTSLAEIGRELSAGFLVESSLRAEGERIRITSKLIRVSDQVQIWSASYDREPASLLAFQSELSTAIAEQVRLRLSPDRLTALARRQTQNVEAYDYYLRGRHFWYQLTPVTTRRAIEYYGRATELDPKYALAWCGIADAYSTSTINGDARPLDVWPRALKAVEQALAAEPSLMEAQMSVGFLSLFLEWKWANAESAFRKAIALDSSYALAHRMLGILLSHMGRHRESLAELRRTRELDPLYAMNHALSCLAAFHAGDYAAAIQFGKQATIIDPEFWIGYFQLAQVHAHLGNTAPALDALKSAGQFSGGNSKVMSLRGHLLAKIGRYDEAREVLTTLQAISRERYVPPYALALVHAGLGDRDEALEWLDRAYEARDVHLIFLPVDPKWDDLRANPRFAALLKRCGFAYKAAG